MNIPVPLFPTSNVPEGSGADDVALYEIVTCCLPLDLNAIVAVAGNRITLSGQSPANPAVWRIDDLNPIVRIAQYVDRKRVACPNNVSFHDRADDAVPLIRTPLLRLPEIVLQKNCSGPPIVVSAALRR